MEKAERTKDSRNALDFDIAHEFFVAHANDAALNVPFWANLSPFWVRFGIFGRSLEPFWSNLDSIFWYLGAIFEYISPSFWWSL